MKLKNDLTIPTEEIFNFVKPYFNGYNDDNIRKVIESHWIYGTIDAVWKNGEIVAVCRWNIISGGKVCDVLDLVIHKNEHGFRIMKHLIARNWHRFPTVRYIRFSRHKKYLGRKPKIYRIADILNLKRS